MHSLKHSSPWPLLLHVIPLLLLVSAFSRLPTSPLALRLVTKFPKPMIDATWARALETAVDIDHPSDFGFVVGSRGGIFTYWVQTSLVQEQQQGKNESVKKVQVGPPRPGSIVYDEESDLGIQGSFALVYGRVKYDKPNFVVFYTGKDKVGVNNFDEFPPLYNNFLDMQTPVTRTQNSTLASISSTETNTPCTRSATTSTKSTTSTDTKVPPADSARVPAPSENVFKPIAVRAENIRPAYASISIAYFVNKIMSVRTTVVNKNLSPYNLQIRTVGTQDIDDFGKFIRFDQYPETRDKNRLLVAGKRMAWVFQNTLLRDDSIPLELYKNGIPVNLEDQINGDSIIDIAFSGRHVALCYANQAKIYKEDQDGFNLIYSIQMAGPLHCKIQYKYLVIAGSSEIQIHDILSLVMADKIFGLSYPIDSLSFLKLDFSNPPPPSTQVDENTTYLILAGRQGQDILVFQPTFDLPINMDQGKDAPKEDASVEETVTDNALQPDNFPPVTQNDCLALTLLSAVTRTSFIAPAESLLKIGSVICDETIQVTYSASSFGVQFYIRAANVDTVMRNGYWTFKIKDNDTCKPQSAAKGDLVIYANSDLRMIIDQKESPNSEGFDWFVTEYSQNHWCMNSLANVNISGTSNFTESFPSPSPSPSMPTMSSQPQQPPSGGSQCFPGNSLVELASGQVVPMSSVRIGDSVRVSPTEFSQVYMFSHRVTNQDSTYLEISVGQGEDQHTIAISSLHMLYVNDKAAKAVDVHEGDILQLADGSRGEVRSIRVVVHKGIYNPKTLHGDIYVNQVRATCYTFLFPPHLAHPILAPVRWLYKWCGWDLMNLLSYADKINTS